MFFIVTVTGIALLLKSFFDNLRWTSIIELATAIFKRRRRERPRTVAGWGEFYLENDVYQFFPFLQMLRFSWAASQCGRSYHGWSPDTLIWRRILRQLGLLGLLVRSRQLERHSFRIWRHQLGTTEIQDMPLIVVIIAWQPP
jgi:hypothetical protein